MFNVRLFVTDFENDIDDPQPSEEQPTDTHEESSPEQEDNYDYSPQS